MLKLHNIKSKVYCMSEIPILNILSPCCDVSSGLWCVSTEFAQCMSDSAVKVTRCLVQLEPVAVCNRDCHEELCWIIPKNYGIKRLDLHTSFQTTAAYIENHVNSQRCGEPISGFPKA